MPHQFLWLQIPEILVIPLVILAIDIGLKLLATGEEFELQHYMEIGNELVVLAAGASGAIFANDTLQEKWDGALITYGILIALACIYAMVQLALIRRGYLKGKIPLWRAARRSMFLGVFAITLVTVPLILGDTITP